LLKLASVCLAASSFSNTDNNSASEEILKILSWHLMPVHSSKTTSIDDLFGLFQAV
jgi:hypothetical protein